MTKEEFKRHLTEIFYVESYTNLNSHTLEHMEREVVKLYDTIYSTGHTDGYNSCIEIDWG